MKSSRMLFLVASTMMSVTLVAVDLEQYITGNKVDADGKTFLHILAENCDNDEFQVELKLFNGVDKKLFVEANELGKEVEILFNLPQQIAVPMFLVRIAGVVIIKDNNGETALDILKRKNAVASPCDRCVIGMNLLQEFHDFIGKLEK